MTMPGFAAENPVYLERSERLDGVFNALMEVASELWVLRDRFTVLEELLAERGSVTRRDLDLFQPGPELSARLAADRRAFLERVMEAAAAGGPR
ncbi:hypothetical protein ABGB12_29630 [Actinocorallia sp. B10E7]|uniref:hypothetical protein n=1 Tax=Actinocorallia sp. B10E7 TaxID=3153558 RepID=UPI00325EF0D1